MLRTSASLAVIALGASFVNVRATLTCRSGGNPLRTRVEVEFLHATQPDTLTDGFGVTWTRI